MTASRDKYLALGLLIYAATCIAIGFAAGVWFA